MSKVTVVGAGNVGATCANVLAFNEVADEVVMLDVKEGVSEGKAMDMMQTAQLLGFDTNIVGCTNDYEKTANSDVVVITSGIPRKPGMTREELIGVNAGIVKSVAQNILKYSPNAIIVVISNPMDTMTYLSLKLWACLRIESSVWVVLWIALVSNISCLKPWVATLMKWKVWLSVVTVILL